MSIPLALPAPPQAMTDTPRALREVCEHLHAAGRFAFDTEFIGETSYRPVLCLIQVATPERVELIDPLAIGDLGPFWEALADPSVEKYCHAGEQDIAIAFAVGKNRPQNIFDTQIAAGLVGLGYPLAYWRLVEHFCDATLDKAHTYSDWARRPLMRAQLSYAVDDVRYLCAVADALGNRLRALRRSAWAVAASQEMCDQSISAPRPEKLFERIKGVGNMQGPALAALRALAIWREQLAYEHDLPPRSFIKDEALLDLAARAPRGVHELGNIRHLPRPEIETYGADIINIIKTAAALPREQWPASLAQSYSDSLNFRSTCEALISTAQLICLGQCVTPAVATSQAQIISFTHRLTQGEDLAGHPLDAGWRRECLGRSLLEFYKGRAALHVAFSEGRAVTRHTPTETALPAAPQNVDGAPCAASPA